MKESNVLSEEGMASLSRGGGNDKKYRRGLKILNFWTDWEPEYVRLVGSGFGEGGAGC